MAKSGSMGHVNKTYFFNFAKKPHRCKKKPEGDGRGQWSVDAMRLATAKGAAVAWWQGPGFGRIPGSKLHSTVRGPLRVKLHVVVKRHPIGVAREPGEEYKLRCRPCHLTAVQNYEIRPKIELVLRQNEKLI
ncbi:hypothetical protein AVEN_115220-1 [Araneus ventricosus]|uniref:Uncharacterized protein n=1 Tax=Araneus ventricosus TaxID=182803 RepID=A0A4Y1ZYX6_ARAVE|nr:hypothetical protein AVEN_115220-1 [Araneus ventricosus]